MSLYKNVFDNNPHIGRVLFKFFDRDLLARIRRNKIRKTEKNVDSAISQLILNMFCKYFF